MIIGKFSLELIERRIFKNDMASSAIKSHVFIGKHIGLWFTRRGKWLPYSPNRFFFTLNSPSRGSRRGSKWGSTWGFKWGSRFCTCPETGS